MNVLNYKYLFNNKKKLSKFLLNKNTYYRWIFAISSIRFV